MPGITIIQVCGPGEEDTNLIGVSADDTIQAVKQKLFRETFDNGGTDMETWVADHTLSFKGEELLSINTVADCGIGSWSMVDLQKTGSGSAGGSAEGAAASRVYATACRPVGDAARDAVRGRLREAFGAGLGASAARDTEAKLAECCEAAMHEKLGRSHRYQARFRSLLFHLRDPKQQFLHAVVAGRVPTAELATMDVRDLGRVPAEAGAGASQVQTAGRQWCAVTGKIHVTGMECGFLGKGKEGSANGEYVYKKEVNGRPAFVHAKGHAQIYWSDGHWKLNGNKSFEYAGWHASVESDDDAPPAGLWQVTGERGSGDPPVQRYPTLTLD